MRVPIEEVLAWWAHVAWNSYGHSIPLVSPLRTYDCRREVKVLSYFIINGHHLKWPRNWVLLTLRFHKTVKSGFLQLLKKEKTPKNVNSATLSTTLHLMSVWSHILHMLMNLNDCIDIIHRNQSKLIEICRETSDKPKPIFKCIDAHNQK